MKTIITTIALTTFLLNPIQAEEKKKLSLEERKTKVLKRIDMRIQELNKKKSCIKSASANKDMKACHEAAKKTRDSLREKYGKKGKNKK